MTNFGPSTIKYGLFDRSVTLNVWGELTVDGAEALYNVLPCHWVCHVTLNIHGKLTDDFLHCTARHVDKQYSLCPITINTWNQLTNERKALFKELQLDKNPAVTLNVCDVHLPSDESRNNEIESIDDPYSLIALLEEAKNTGKENLTVTINVGSDDDRWSYSDVFISFYSGDCTGRSLGLTRNCSLRSLTLTINNFSQRRTGLSPALIGVLEGCSSLKSLTLTLNEYNQVLKDYASHLRKGLGRNTSVISLTLTINMYSRVDYSSFETPFDYISDDGFVPNISMNSFTLTVNDFSINSSLELGSGVLWSNYKSLTTFSLALNNCIIPGSYKFSDFLDAVMKVNSLRTLRLKIKDSRFRIPYRECDLSKLVVKSPSLELIELTISHYGDVGSLLETLKWEK